MPLLIQKPGCLIIVPLALGTPLAPIYMGTLIIILFEKAAVSAPMPLSRRSRKPII